MYASSEFYKAVFKGQCFVHFKKVLLSLWRNKTFSKSKLMIRGKKTSPTFNGIFLYFLENPETRIRSCRVSY